MNKLTLPIEEGKKYVQRDGTVVTSSASESAFWVELSGSATVTRAAGKYWHNSRTEHDCDLVADYIEPASVGHVHAASMLLYAQDAAETDKPWERWECASTSQRGMWTSCTGVALNLPLWLPSLQYRRKPPAPKFILINGHQVPEPMRVAPARDCGYWHPAVNESIGKFTQISTWDDDGLDRQRLERGICHLTREAAELHATALLSFTKAK